MNHPPEDRTERLRRKAEELRESKQSEATSSLSDSDMKKLVQELEVHQIELEMQNEELEELRNTALAAADKYTEFFDFAPLGYIVLDEKRQIMEINRAGALMLGHEKTEVLNSQLGIFISPETRKIYHDFIGRTFAGHKNQTCEVVIATDFKDPIHVALTSNTTQDNRKCLLTASDITERKRIQEAMVETQRLGAIGEMASAVAHDFNNSLQIILGYIELLLLVPNLKEKTLEHMECVKIVIKDTACRIKQLQRFGRKKTADDQYRIINLNTLLHEAILQSKPLWKDNSEKEGISIIIIEKYCESSTISGNEGELKAAVFNIIKNSIEAMPSGGRIFIETRKEGDQIILSVTDTGTGMSEESRHRIFQPFYTTKGFIAGRGLGMSGVYGTVREHGGKIRVRNTEISVGTTIELFLPAAVSKEPECAIAQITPSPAKTCAYRVLWVEDEEIVREFAKTLLPKMGHEIDTACCGAEALEYLERNTYDLVITDIGMPGMSGWQLADVIQEKFEGKLPVCAVTGWGNEIGESKKLQHNIRSVVCKPFSIKDIKILLDRIPNFS